MASNRNDYTLHLLENIQSAIQVLRATVDRRFAPDKVVDSKFDAVDLEIAMLRRELFKGESNG